MEETIKEEKVAAPKKTVKRGIVFDCFLNLRRRPSYDAEVETVIPKDGIVTILSGKDPNFYKVSYNDIEGYCCKDYIREVK